jgi:hypothetical protein
MNQKAFYEPKDTATLLETQALNRPGFTGDFIEDPVVIKKILTYLEEKLAARTVLLLPESRAPPQSSLFG